MRQIEFRGMDFDGKWVFGCYVKYLSQCYIYSVNKTNIKSVPVIYETIGQFTGLYDKNGVKIFEGDIIRIPYNGFKDTVVKYLEEELRWNISNYNLGVIYVINNIHEREEETHE